MSDIVPFIYSQEQACVKEEITGKDLSVIFNGMTHLSEAMAILVHYVDSNLEIKQRLIRDLLKVYQESRWLGSWLWDFLRSTVLVQLPS